jgi:hypothetical protein
MVQVVVGGQPETLENPPETWGGVLAMLDARLGASRRVVTAVRFDGVDQPSFRAPEVRAAAVGALARIDVDTEEALVLLRTAVDAAADSLPELVTGVRLTAAAIRAGAPSAVTDVGALIVALQSLMTLTAAAATAADASLGADRASDAALADGCGRIEAVLRAVVAQQGAGEWSGVADTLDGHLAPAVAGWSDVLTPIRLRAAA